jgi:hypothetical protein
VTTYWTSVNQSLACPGAFSVDRSTKFHQHCSCSFIRKEESRYCLPIIRSLYVFRTKNSYISSYSNVTRVEECCKYGVNDVVSLIWLVIHSLHTNYGTHSLPSFSWHVQKLPISYFTCLFNACILDLHNISSNRLLSP